MPLHLDLTGRKFGDLIVLNRISGRKRVYWRCRCSCGREKDIQGSHLRTGSIISCGCKGKSRREKALKHGTERRAGTGSLAAVVRKVMREYKNSAKVDGREFMLAENDFGDLLSFVCFYCGSAPSRSVKLPSGAVHVVGGIDRFDNERGYTIGNVVPCCRSCNLRKHQRNAGTFIRLHKPARQYMLDGITRACPAVLLL